MKAILSALFFSIPLFAADADEKLKTSLDPEPWNFKKITPEEVEQIISALEVKWEEKRRDAEFLKWVNDVDNGRLSSF